MTVTLSQASVGLLLRIAAEAFGPSLFAKLDKEIGPRRPIVHDAPDKSTGVVFFHTLDFDLLIENLMRCGERFSAGVKGHFVFVAIACSACQRQSFRAGLQGNHDDGACDDNCPYEKTHNHKPHIRRLTHRQFKKASKRTRSGYTVIVSSK